MSETQKTDPLSLGLYITPEVTARRLNKVIRMYLDFHEDPAKESVLQNLIDPITLSRILKDNNFWISNSLEYKIIKKIQESIPVDETFFTMGKDFFLADSFEILPSDDVQIEFKELISRLPILIDHYLRYVNLRDIIYSSNSIQFEFHFNKKINEHFYDLIFLAGILHGAAILFQVSDFKTTLLETSLSAANTNFLTISEATKFNAKKTIIELSWSVCKIKVGKTNINKISPAFESKTFVISSLNEADKGQYSYIDLNDIVSKSSHIRNQKFHKNK